MTGDKLPEKLEQELLASYLNNTDLLWCHVPNGGMRHKLIAENLRRAGVKAGVPDVLIFTKPKSIEYKDKAGLAIELKKLGSARPTVHQKKWLNDLAKNGWVSAVCHGHKAAIELIQEVYGIYK